MRALARRDRSLFDNIFGSPLDILDRIPDTGWFSYSYSGPQGLREIRDDKGYTLEITLPSDLNISAVDAEISGNILRVTVPMPEVESKKLQINKASNDNSEEGE